MSEWYRCGVASAVGRADEKKPGFPHSLIGRRPPTKKEKKIAPLKGALYTRTIHEYIFSSFSSKRDENNRRFSSSKYDQFIIGPFDGPMCFFSLKGQSLIYFRANVKKFWWVGQKSSKQPTCYIDSRLCASYGNDDDINGSMLPHSKVSAVDKKLSCSSCAPRTFINLKWTAYSFAYFMPPAVASSFDYHKDNDKTIAWNACIFLSTQWGWYFQTQFGLSKRLTKEMLKFNMAWALLPRSSKNLKIKESSE